MSVSILIGDCRERLKELPDASVDSVVCDPPYHLTTSFTPLGLTHTGDRGRGAKPAPATRRTGFMGQTWDGGDVAFDPATWAEVLRVLKPGGHLIAFSGTRTYHRMVCAIEDAGFEVRDQLAWVYGSGFPKSLDVSKQIDKAAGAEREVIGPSPFAARKPNGSAGVNSIGLTATPGHDLTAPATDAAREWQGWGTALKPSWEPICLARKPLEGTVAGNVLKYGTGSINIDACRIHADDAQGGEYEVKRLKPGATLNKTGGNWRPEEDDAVRYKGEMKPGRWPGNFCHDGSDEVLAGFPTEAGGRTSGEPRSTGNFGGRGIYGAADGAETPAYTDAGSAARFFYCAKATTDERGEGNTHPTVKPKALMEWLIKLVTPPGGTVLDPFMGSGSTGLAADALQFNFIGCELSPEYAAIAERRIRDAAGLFAEVKAA